MVDNKEKRYLKIVPFLSGSETEESRPYEGLEYYAEKVSAESVVNKDPSMREALGIVDKQVLAKMQCYKIAFDAIYLKLDARDGNRERTNPDHVGSVRCLIIDSGDRNRAERKLFVYTPQSDEALEQHYNDAFEKALEQQIQKATNPAVKASLTNGLDAHRRDREANKHIGPTHLTSINNGVFPPMVPYLAKDKEAFMRHYGQCIAVSKLVNEARRKQAISQIGTEGEAVMPKVREKYQERDMLKGILKRFQGQDMLYE